MKEYLDSNRVNFLIWRYLIEGNYRETAVKFQKEWHIEEPLRQLDFARHVKSHALVSVLNKGLLYSSLERDYEQSQVPQNATAVAEVAMQQQQQQQQQQKQQQLGVFGPVVANPSVHNTRVEEVPEHDPEEDAEGESDDNEVEMEMENPRKRPVDRPQQAQVNGGSPAKRPRLSNGYENGVDAATDPMELDGDNHAYPSPLEGEQAPTPIPRTDGPEQGTQVEKVEELAPETTFIPLGSDEAPVSSPLTTMSRINSENAPVLLHCQWNPRDPSILAAAGTDALARVWTVSRATTLNGDRASTSASTSHVNGSMSVPPFHSLIEDDISHKSTVTAMAWNWDGTAIAIATDSETKARISLWSTDGTHIHHFEVAEPPVIKIRWNPNNAAILGIAPDNGGTLITVYHSMTSNSMSYYLSQHDLQAEPLDAAWISENEFLICGGDLLMSLKCTETEIIETKKFETREDDSLTQVQFDWRSNLAATCGEKGFVDIWDATGKRREIKAHVDAVTALAWQPLQSPPAEDERLIASGGEDGAIFIYNALSTDGKAKCSMTMGPPIVALAFTPDGAFIAGATSDRILIWKVGDHSIPRASWNRMPHPGWLSPKIGPESDEEDEHCLCWDSTGHRLAYGVNSRLAIINFR